MNKEPKKFFTKRTIILLSVLAGVGVVTVFLYFWNRRPTDIKPGTYIDRERIDNFVPLNFQYEFSDGSSIIVFVNDGVPSIDGDFSDIPTLLFAYYKSCIPLENKGMDYSFAGTVGEETYFRWVSNGRVKADNLPMDHDMSTMDKDVAHEMSYDYYDELYIFYDKKGLDLD